MKLRIIIFVVVLAALAALVWWSGLEKKTHRPARRPLSGQMPPAGMEQAGEIPHASMMPLPTVAGITLNAQTEGGETYPPVQLKLGEAAQLPGTPYALRFSDFYTHWNWDGVPQNLSYEPVNPAAKVEVLKGGSVQYYAWAFQNMPFFRMGHHAPGMGEEQPEQLAFTLVGYEGLKLPGHGMGSE